MELVLQDELLTSAHERQIDRRVKSGCSSENSSRSTDFDWSFNPSIHKKQLFDLATCRFMRERRDVLLLRAARRRQDRFWRRRSAIEAIKQGFVVLYRSIFDVVRDFLHDEALGDDDKVLARYLKPDLLDHRRHGDEAVAEAERRSPVRDHHAALRNPLAR